MNYIIRIDNPGSHICNPLLKLKDREFAKREDACEAIYSALYDVIDSAEGCEMVDAPDWNSFDEDYINAKDKYISDCHNLIMSDGYATEDGVTATVEEQAD